MKPPGDGARAATPPAPGAPPAWRARLADPIVLVSLAFFLVWVSVALFFRPIGDFGVETDFYGELAYYARQWTQGHGGLMTGFRGPLYPILLGLLTLPFRDAFLVGKLLSVLGAALGLWLTGDLVRRRFGRVAGAVAALALAANTTFTDHAYRACTDLFYFALFAGTLWWLLRDDDDSDRRWIWAGVLGGAAWLTRYNGLALLPAGLLAAALGGHAPRRAARHALLFALAMTLVAAPWAFYVWSQTGDPLWSNNYQNVALEVLGGRSALAQAGTFMAATDFRSVGEVYATWPARFRQVMFGNLVGHAREDLLQLATLPWGLAALLGWALGFRRWLNRRGALFLVMGLLTYLSLVPIYYNPRYMITLLVWWGAGVGLLAETVAGWLSRPGPAVPAAGKRKAAPRPAPRGGAAMATGLIAAVALLALALTLPALRRSQDPTRSGGIPLEILGVAREARRTGYHFDESTPIASRRPHLGYYLGAPVVPVPAGTFEDMRKAGVHYLLVSGSEVSIYPGLTPLWTPAPGTPPPPGLRLVARTLLNDSQGRPARAAALYAIDNAAPWRRAASSPLRPARPPDPEFARLDALRLQLARWYIHWNSDMDAEALFAQMSPAAREKPDALRARADAALERNDAAGAARLYTRLLELRPGDAPAALGLATLAWLRQDRADMRRWLSVALADEPAAGRAAAAPIDTTGMSGRPDWGGTPAPTYQAIQDAGMRYLKAQDFAGSVAPLATMVEIDPTARGAWIDLAYSLQGIRRGAAAEAVMRDVLKRFPNDPEALLFLRQNHAGTP